MNRDRLQSGQRLQRTVPEGTISPTEGRSGRIALKDIDLVAERGVLDDQCLVGTKRRKQKLKNEIEHNLDSWHGSVSP